MGIESKTLGQLIDELSIINLRLWNSQDTMMSSKNNDIIAEAAVNTQNLNKKRNALIKAIDQFYGNTEFTVEDKTY